MPQIDFDGEGTPIPTVALPPFGSDGDLPQTTLTFTDSTDFSVADYMSLGFTHFEALCVGAAGGRGGDSVTSLFFATEYFRRAVPQDVWNLHLEAVRLRSYFQWAEWDNTAAAGGLTAVQVEEQQNPRHIMEFGVVKQILPRLTQQDYEATGGGGGGGGFQRVSGTLESLDAVIPIVVGKAGPDAPAGVSRVNGLYTPAMTDPSGPHGIYSYGYGGYWQGQNPISPHSAQNVFVANGQPIPAQYQQRWIDIANFFDSYLFTYPDPHVTFLPPQPGGDGGPSSFADGVSMASGGKGGAPGKVYNGVTDLNNPYGFAVKGDGGDGGIGGQLEAGGGGKGSAINTANGEDGFWHPLDGIGAGGGGGKGGYIKTSGQDQGLKMASAGGQGSYSYADASVYGPRQMRSLYAPPYSMWGKGKLKGPSDYFGDYIDSQSSLIPNGEIEYRYDAPAAIDPRFGDRYTTATPLLVIPGGGGGARPLKNLKFGSRSLGYSPDGVVVLRLSRIT